MSALTETENGSTTPSARAAPLTLKEILSFLMRMDIQWFRKEWTGTLKRCPSSTATTVIFRRFHSPMGLRQVTHVKGVKLPSCCVRKSADESCAESSRLGLLPKSSTSLKILVEGDCGKSDALRVARSYASTRRAERPRILSPTDQGPAMAGLF